MKKILAVGLAAVVLLMSAGPVSAGEGRGGFMGLIAGCCFGIRAAGEYNEGKDIHWREWGTIIPYVGIIFTIWNGIDSASGITSADLAAKYGSAFY